MRMTIARTTTTLTTGSDSGGEERRCSSVHMGRIVAAFFYPLHFVGMGWSFLLKFHWVPFHGIN